MIGFNAIETAQITATSENKSVAFKDPAGLSASQVMLDNEGINTVYFSEGELVKVPAEEAAPGGVPILPMSSKILTKGSGNGIFSVITASGTSKINITLGQGF